MEYVTIFTKVLKLLIEFLFFYSLFHYSQKDLFQTGLLYAKGKHLAAALDDGLNDLRAHLILTNYVNSQPLAFYLSIARLDPVHKTKNLLTFKLSHPSCGTDRNLAQGKGYSSLLAPPRPATPRWRQIPFSL